MAPGQLLLAILCLQFLIVVHEWGHYFFARLFGMKVARFSIGFGPKLLSFKRNGTEFLFSAVPFGGYVQIVGMAAEEAVDPNDKDAYPNKPMWQRFVVILMGPVMNFVLAAVCFILMYNLGFERAVTTEAKIGRVIAGSAAEQAGLQPGDRILSIDGKPVATFDEIPAVLQTTEAETVALLIQRQGEQLTLSVTPSSESGARRLGIEPPAELVRAESFAGSLSQGLALTWDRTTGTVKAFAGLFTRKKDGGRLVGIPGIVKMLGLQIDRGLSALLALLAALSISLCVFNLAPIPALDGSRLLFLGIEGIRHKRVNERVENAVNTVGFVFVFGLILFASVRDLL